MSVHPNFLDYRSIGVERTARARLPASLFRTHDLPPAERFRAWHESVGVFLETNVLPGDDAAAFNGSVESYLLDGVMLSRCTAGRQKFDRSALRIANDGIDHYMVQLFLRGRVEMEMGQHVLFGTPAQVVGFDLGEVLNSINSKFDLLCVVVPRRQLAPLLTHPDSLHGAMPLLEGGAAALLANFLRDLFTILPHLAPPGDGAARALLELIATAFNGVNFAANDNPQLAHYALGLRAKRFVKDRLGSPGLNADAVATAMGVSRSALYRLFNGSGGVSEYIREQRLRRCFSELVRAQSSSVQIAQIAYRWGFADPAHFARLFKARFGCTPSETRDRATAAILHKKSGFDGRIGDRYYEEWIAGLA